MTDAEPERQKLRRFVGKHFNDEELIRFSFDYFPDVYDDFAQGMSKGQKVLRLIDFCMRRERLPELEAALERERPQPYEEAFSAESKSSGTAAPPMAPAADERNPQQVFISHAHQDGALAHRLAVDLQEDGWQVWIAPDSIRPGEKWVEAINRGLDESGVFLVLLTPDAVESRWVRSETNIAIELEHSGELRFIPLGVEETNVPTIWRAYQRIPFGSDYAAGLQALRAGLEAEQRTPAPQASAKQRAQKLPKPIRDHEELPRPASSNSYPHEKSGLEMIHIPAGLFLYGENKQQLDLPEFWISKTAVTNAQYAQFVSAAGYNSPQLWQGKTAKAELTNHPVTFVSWHDAQAYAGWAGMNLPTEEEWEKAARGTDGRLFPWGNAWKDGFCNTSEAGIGSTTPVSQFSPQGDSPYGCVDMAGNVWEWTASWYDKDEQRRVVRGGSWLSNRINARAASRNRFNPVSRDGNYGFRVVVRRPPSR